jgi:hypothetical protein
VEEEQEAEMLSYEYSIKNVKTDLEMFGTVNVNLDIMKDITFDELKPLILVKAKEQEAQFENSEDVEITMLKKVFVGVDND